MGKKVIKIDGKSYLVDSDTKQMEEVETEEEASTETSEEEEASTEEDTSTDEDETSETSDEVETKINSAASRVVKELGLDEIKKQIKSISDELKSKGKETDSKKVSALLDLEVLMQKDVNKMTTREKVIGFFQAMIQNNESVLKALSEGTAADGGFLFPNEFRYEVIRDIAEGNYMRGEVTVVPMKRDIMNIPSLESRPKVTWTAENATKSTTTAHFSQQTLTARKMAAILYASDELIEDAAEIDVVNFIIGLFSEVIGEEEDNVIWTGNGTTQPTGVETARAAGTIASLTAANATLSLDDVIALMHELPAKYHKNAKFWTHRHNIRDLRKLKDANSRYYWQEPVSAGQPATLYGYPVIEVNYLNANRLYFGDMKQAYWFGDRQKMTVKISQDTETAFTKDETAIRVVERIAGNVVNGRAIKALIGI